MVAGSQGEPIVRAVELDRPMTEWKHAWETARKRAGVTYRWHDARHTFVSRLAESPYVSEQTIMALAGHVSKRMLELAPATLLTLSGLARRVPNTA